LPGLFVNSLESQEPRTSFGCLVQESRAWRTEADWRRFNQLALQLLSSDYQHIHEFFALAARVKEDPRVAAYSHRLGAQIANLRRRLSADSLIEMILLINLYALVLLREGQARLTIVISQLSQMRSHSSLSAAAYAAYTLQLICHDIGTPEADRFANAVIHPFFDLLAGDHPLVPALYYAYVKLNEQFFNDADRESYLRMAADRGHGPGALALGNIYKSKWLLSSELADWNCAAEYYARASRLGCAEAAAALVDLCMQREAQGQFLLSDEERVVLERLGTISEERGDGNRMFLELMGRNPELSLAQKWYLADLLNAGVYGQEFFDAENEQGLSGAEFVRQLIGVYCEFGRPNTLLPRTIKLFLDCGWPALQNASAGQRAPLLDYLQRDSYLRGLVTNQAPSREEMMQNWEQARFDAEAALDLDGFFTPPASPRQGR